MASREVLADCLWRNYLSYFQYKVPPFDNIKRVIELKKAVEVNGAIPGIFGSPLGRIGEPADFINGVIETLANVSDVYAGVSMAVDPNKMYGHCKGSALNFYLDSKLLKVMPWELDTDLRKTVATLKAKVHQDKGIYIYDVYCLIKEVNAKLNELIKHVGDYQLKCPGWAPDVWYMLYLQHAIITTGTMLGEV